jgi:hypothetical protein
MIEELEWLHEPSATSQQGHGGAFGTEEELAKKVLGNWTTYNAPGKEVRKCLVDMIEKIVEEVSF